jgi:hypothetical protein
MPARRGRSAGSFAGCLVDVEVDPETGKVTILRFTSVQDAGKAIHPAYVEGQMQGGSVQGIGWALNEEYFYDEKGLLRNAALLDYMLSDGNGVELGVEFVQTVPQMQIIVSLPIHMDSGETEVFTGYRVLYNTSRGPGKGGIRLEDMGVVTTNGFRDLTRMPREFRV